MAIAERIDFERRLASRTHPGAPITDRHAPHAPDPTSPPDRIATELLILDLAALEPSASEDLLDWLVHRPLEA